MNKQNDPERKLTRREIRERQMLANELHIETAEEAAGRASTPVHGHADRSSAPEETAGAQSARYEEPNPEDLTPEQLEQLMAEYAEIEAGIDIPSVNEEGRERSRREIRELFRAEFDRRLAERRAAGIRPFADLAQTPTPEPPAASESAGAGPAGDEAGSEPEAGAIAGEGEGNPFEDAVTPATEAFSVEELKAAESGADARPEENEPSADAGLTETTDDADAGGASREKRGWFAGLMQRKAEKQAEAEPEAAEPEAAEPEAAVAPEDYQAAELEAAVIEGLDSVDTGAADIPAEVFDDAATRALHLDEDASFEELLHESVAAEDVKAEEGRSEEQAGLDGVPTAAASTETAHAGPEAAAAEQHENEREILEEIFGGDDAGEEIDPAPAPPASTDSDGAGSASRSDAVRDADRAGDPARSDEPDPEDAAGAETSTSVAAPKSAAAGGYSFPDIAPLDEGRSVFDDPERAERDDADDRGFDHLISRAVSEETSTSTTNGTSALILPQMPTDLTGPLGSTGDLFVSGSIELPKSYGETGAHRVSVEDLGLEEEDASEASPHTTDHHTQPVSASRAVSAQPHGYDLVSPQKKDHSKMPLVFSIGGGALIVGVGAVLYWGFSTGAFGG